MPVRRVTPPEARALVDQGWKYVDVRSVPEFEQGHPAGAWNVPLLHMEPGKGMVPNPEFADVFSRTFGKDEKLVLGCKSGGRSLRAAEQMTTAGYTNLVDMRGGWGGELDALGQPVVKGWKDEGLPVETAARSGRAWTELKK
jgi:rhodanese-related sulfurtransferase